MAQNMPQSGALVVVGNRHADIKRLRILGVSQNPGDAHQPPGVVERGEGDMVDTVDRVDEMSTRGRGRA